MSGATSQRTATTDDVFLAGASAGSLHILQPADGLRSGLDAVVLAAAAPVLAGESVLDAGSGVGVVGLAVARRCPLVRVTLIEREPDLTDLARVNIERNGLTARCNAICADLTQPLAAFGEQGLAPETFDHVLANPPFHDAGQVRVSPRGLKAGASAFGVGDLDRWLRFLAAMAKPGGKLTLIHRADALRAVLDAIGQRFGDLAVFPLFPRADTPASRILVTGIKGSRGPLRLLAGLVLHGPDGHYTPEAEHILRAGAALVLKAKS